MLEGQFVLGKLKLPSEGFSPVPGWLPDGPTVGQENDHRRREATGGGGRRV